MKITLDWLTRKNACVDAREAFAAKFHDGAEYRVVQDALRDALEIEWSAWLTERGWRDIIESPENIREFTLSEVDRALADTKGSPNSASGNGSTAASSGYRSTAASRGKNSIAMVAGIGGRAKAGEDGCLALSWHDGNRNRIVVGYVGEDGIKADTWYRVEAGKLVEAA